MKKRFIVLVLLVALLSACNEKPPEEKQITSTEDGLRTVESGETNDSLKSAEIDEPSRIVWDVNDFTYSESYDYFHLIGYGHNRVRWNNMDFIEFKEFQPYLNTTVFPHIDMGGVIEGYNSLDAQIIKTAFLVVDGTAQPENSFVKTSAIGMAQLMVMNPSDEVRSLIDSMGESQYTDNQIIDTPEFGKFLLYVGSPVVGDPVFETYKKVCEELKVKFEISPTLTTIETNMDVMKRFSLSYNENTVWDLALNFNKMEMTPQEEVPRYKGLRYLADLVNKLGYVSEDPAYICYVTERLDGDTVQFVCAERGAEKWHNVVLTLTPSGSIVIEYVVADDFIMAITE